MNGPLFAGREGQFPFHGGEQTARVAVHGDGQAFGDFRGSFAGSGWEDVTLADKSGRSGDSGRLRQAAAFDFALSALAAARYASRMFVIIYRWRLQPGQEAEFRTAWEELSAQYMQLRGQHDAKLTQGDDGVWVGKAIWPDRETYILALERGVPDPRVANRMNAAVAERLDPEFRFID